LRGFTDFYYIVVNNTMIKEIWKTVVIDGVEHPRYKVSSIGRVMNIDFRGTGKSRLCKLSVGGHGYLQVVIDRVPKLVHRLVAEAFIANSEGKKEVDHIDTNRQNNCVWNLRWATSEENSNNPLSVKHYSENNPWRGKFGADNHSSVSIVQLTLEGKFIKKWGAAREVQRELGINGGHIASCCKGKRNKAGGYRWVYASDYKPPVRYINHISEIKPLF